MAAFAYKQTFVSGKTRLKKGKRLAPIVYLHALETNLENYHVEPGRTHSSLPWTNYRLHRGLQPVG
jgi:hypothetical protein